MTDPNSDQAPPETAAPSPSRYEQATQWPIWIFIFVALVIGFLLS
jgi:hypothetical protein